MNPYHIVCKFTKILSSIGTCLIRRCGYRAKCLSSLVGFIFATSHKDKGVWSLANYREDILVGSTALFVSITAGRNTTRSRGTATYFAAGYIWIGGCLSVILFILITIIRSVFEPSRKYRISVLDPLGSGMETTEFQERVSRRSPRMGCGSGQ